MCCKHTSSGNILYLRLGPNLLPEIGAEKRWRIQVDRPSEDRRELVLHGKEGQPRNMSGLEFDQHVDVALRAKIIAQDRAEECEPCDMMPPVALLSFVNAKDFTFSHCGISYAFHLEKPYPK